MQSTRDVQIHRFGDRVAVSVGTGPTCYVEASDAVAMGRALLACAGSVRREPFREHTFGTFRLAETRARKMRKTYTEGA